MLLNGITLLLVKEFKMYAFKSAQIIIFPIIILTLIAH